MTIGLDGAEGAYLRLRASLTRSFEAAIEFQIAGTESAIEERFEQDLSFLDAAFFVILFGFLEQQLRSIAAERSKDARMKEHLLSRNAAFAQVLDAALQDDARLRREIERWDGPRNDAAHGRRLSQSYEIVAIVDRCRYLDELLREISGQASD